jgi:hypothetical protein
MTQEQRNLIIAAIDTSLSGGQTPKDEERRAYIEAVLRDALGQNHGVWRWRVGRMKGNGASDGDKKQRSS